MSQNPEQEHVASAALEGLEVSDASIETSAIGSVSGRDVTMSMSAVGGVSASGGARIEQGLTGGVLTAGDVELHQAAAGAIIAGGDVEVTQGGSQWLLAAGDVTVGQGGAAAIAARSVSIQKGWVGVVASPHAQIGDGVKVVLDPKGAAIFGAAVGSMIALGIALAIRWRDGGCCE